jgi:hypothetical protein
MMRDGHFSCIFGLTCKIGGLFGRRLPVVWDSCSGRVWNLQVGERRTISTQRFSTRLSSMLTPVFRHFAREVASPSGLSLRGFS